MTNKCSTWFYDVIFIKKREREKDEEDDVRWSWYIKCYFKRLVCVLFELYVYYSI